MSLVPVVAALSMLAVSAVPAQERLTIAIPEVVASVVSGAVVPPVPVAVEPAGQRVGDLKFWLVGAALNTAMIFDTRSTFDVKRRCARCVEADPFAAPFIERGPALAYSAGEAFDVGVLALAARMKGAQRASVRRLWWVVPAALTAGHILAYRSNLRVAQP
jgi:hypothetical protein